MWRQIGWLPFSQLYPVYTFYPVTRCKFKPPQWQAESRNCHNIVIILELLHMAGGEGESPLSPDCLPGAAKMPREWDLGKVGVFGGLSRLVPGALRLALAVTLAWNCGAARAEEQAAPAIPALVASSVHASASGSHLSLEMGFDAMPAFTTHYVDQPPRLIVDLPRTHFSLPEDSIKAQGLLKSLRFGTMAEGKARLVLTLSHPARLVAARAEALKSGKGARLLLEAEKIGQNAFTALIATQKWDNGKPQEKSETPDLLAPANDPASGPFIIAVDAGHGGIDTGATSPDGKILEKDITLAFAQSLVKALNQEPGIQAFLTRDKDEFLSLTERVDISRRRKANLFISFHADKLKQDDIRGATVYTISDKASDSLSANLAERENFSDEVAGIVFEDEPEEVADILLDLTRRETQAFSVTFAESVIRSFKGQVELINNPHRSAGFRVLRAPEIPSILLELGFLSNKKDVSLLQEPAQREKIATLLTQAIRAYRAPVSAAGNGG